MFVLPISCCSVLRSPYTQSTLNSVVLRKMTLLHLMMKQLAQCWLHYEDEQVDNAWVATFALLFLETKSHSHKSCGSCHFSGLVPVHYLACIDPAATWFSIWMAKARPRQQMLRFMLQTGVFSELMHCSMHNGDVVRTATLAPDVGALCQAHVELSRALLHKVWIELRFTIFRLVMMLIVLASLCFAVVVDGGGGAECFRRTCGLRCELVHVQFEDRQAFGYCQPLPICARCRIRQYTAQLGAQC